MRKTLALHLIREHLSTPDCLLIDAGLSPIPMMIHSLLNEYETYRFALPFRYGLLALDFVLVMTTG